MIVKTIFLRKLDLVFEIPSDFSNISAAEGIYEN